MTTGPIDFASVQWARKRSTELEALLALPADEMGKLANFLEKLAALKAADVTPTPAQMTVLLQNLHTKNLTSLEGVRGGMIVEFSGGGFVYERYLLKNDGRIPNYKYESKKAP